MINNNAIDCIKNIVEYWSSNPNEQAFAKASILRMLECIDSDWIDVNDLLPEDDKTLHFYEDSTMKFTTVLTFSERGRDCTNRLLIKNLNNELAQDTWEWSCGKHVTHWMPLPQSPKK